MNNYNQFRGMLTMRQVRIASVFVVPGLLCHFLLVPMLAKGPWWLGVPLSIFGGFATWPLMIWITLSVPGWRGVIPGELDEREFADRDASFVFAYRFIGATLFALYVFAKGVDRHWWGAPGITTIGELGLNLAMFHMALPGILLAWRARADRY